mmetsp:Transcript_60556/g.91355  ORF Transcript_60556/g.91355 Transcript_60556/m.91355 type:complete len:91 (-) Transcript_60556:174-446(-)
MVTDRRHKSSAIDGHHSNPGIASLLRCDPCMAIATALQSHCKEKRDCVSKKKEKGGRREATILTPLSRASPEVLLPLPVARGAARGEKRL